MRSFYRYFFIAILLIIVGLLQYEFWFSRGGMIQNHHLQKKLVSEKKLLDEQKAENKKLLANVMKIKNNPQLIENQARDELGMVKKGEEYIEIAIKPGHD